MVRIRLRRVGARNQPSYRIVAADKESPRDGRFLEILGHYNPRTEPSTVSIDEARLFHWLKHGAQPSDAVVKVLRSLGTWERWDRFKKGESLDTLLEEAKAAIPDVDPRTRRDDLFEKRRKKKAKKKVAAAVEQPPEVEVEEQPAEVIAEEPSPTQIAEDVEAVVEEEIEAAAAETEVEAEKELEEVAAEETPQVEEEPEEQAVDDAPEVEDELESGADEEETEESETVDEPES
jgi:small subunit ribosomal protein S16